VHYNNMLHVFSSNT